MYLHNSRSYDGVDKASTARRHTIRCPDCDTQFEADTRADECPLCHTEFHQTSDYPVVQWSEDNHHDEI